MAQYKYWVLYQEFGCFGECITSTGEHFEDALEAMAYVQHMKDTGKKYLQHDKREKVSFNITMENIAAHQTSSWTIMNGGLDTMAELKQTQEAKLHHDGYLHGVGDTWAQINKKQGGQAK
jgi:hypothetical protein